MKVLFITSCYPDELLPQYCIFIEQQAKALKELGHEVDVIVPYPLKDDYKYEPSVSNGLKIYKVPYTVKSFKGVIFFRDVRFISNIIEILKKNDYDIVSIHYLLIDKVLEMCINACYYQNIKTVVHFHGLNVWKDYYHPHPIIQKFQSKRRKKILLKADCLVGVSKKVSKIIKERINNKPIFVVYNGVDTKKFISSKSDTNSNKLRIICVANLIPIKGQQYLIDACCKMHEEGLDVELNLIGRGSDEKKLKERVILQAAENYVYFKGYIPYKQVIAELNKNDVFVMPSFFEALGCVYLEAMSMKLPVIGVVGQGIDEIIIDGNNGFLVEPQSSASIYNKLKWIYDHKLESKEIAIKGFETVNNNYQWADSAKMLEKVYKMTMENEGR